MVAVLKNVMVKNSQSGCFLSTHDTHGDAVRLTIPMEMLSDVGNIGGG